MQRQVRKWTVLKYNHNGIGLFADAIDYFWSSLVKERKYEHKRIMGNILAFEIAIPPKAFNRLGRDCFVRNIIFYLQLVFFYSF